MSTRLLGWLAAALAMLITLALVVGEVMDGGLRRLWGAHPLTTNTVAGLLVLLHQLRSAAAPLLRMLSPEVREAVQSIGRTAEE